MIDYTGMSYRELLAQREQLEAHIQAAHAGERRQVIEEIREKMAEYDITLAELGSRAAKAARKDKGQPLPAKYRDPDSDATWSGRGKPPRWIDGKDRERFLVV
jgi:DNA-binding protein H-NS